MQQHSVPAGICCGNGEPGICVLDDAVDVDVDVDDALFPSTKLSIYHCVCLDGRDSIMANA